MKLILFIVVCCIVSAFSSDPLPPPLWPERFSQSFIQRDISSKIYISGKLYYDMKNNRQRCDVQKDYFDLLCSSVSQSQNSSCSQVIMNDKLYIYLPDENLCCKCCTAEEGCKITSRDWLKDFQYIGPYVVNWEVYDRWSHYDMPRNITYSASQDEQRTPKCIETGSYGIDFLTGTYSEE